MSQLRSRLRKIAATLLLVSLFSFALESSAYGRSLEREARFLLQAGTYDFSATSSLRSGAVSGFGAYSFGVEYCFLDSFAASASYNYLKSSGVGGDTSIGIDAAIKYYPVTYAGYKTSEVGPLSIEISQLWRPYVGFALRQREFVIVLTTNYIGYGFFAGVDYQLHKKWFLNFEFRMDKYFGGTQDAEADMTNIMLGVGYQF